MPLSALGLVIVAAVLHATWHLLLKQTEQRQLFTGWVLALAAVIYSPILFLFAPVTKWVWMYAVISAIVQAAYFVLLVQAYEHADFSFAYPIARGAAPAFLCLWGIALLGDRVSIIGLVGIACLLTGLVVVGIRFRRRVATEVRTRDLLVALSVALCISVYSAIDGKVVKTTPVIPYLALVTVLTGVFVSPFVFSHYSAAQALACWRSHRGRIMLVGILPSIPYLLILRVYAISGVSYAGALREVSIVFAAIAGRFLLGEQFGAVRIVGSLLIFTGIIVIALAG
jgi:multidrug transporter EmrE-like cation transporter